MKVYIAFSIKGTNKFIVATKAVNDNQYIQMCRNGFSRANSRRPGYDPSDGQKMHWGKLLKSDGMPHTSPSWVLRRFNELAQDGWTIIGKEEFIKRHYKSNARCSPRTDMFKRNIEQIFNFSGNPPNRILTGIEECYNG